MSKSIHSIASNVLGLVLLLLLLSLFPQWGFAQSQRGGVTVLRLGPGESPLLNQPSTTGEITVWVDTVHKTAVWAATAITSNCQEITPGSFSIVSRPTHGKLFFDRKH